MNIFVILLLCITSGGSRALERPVKDVDEDRFIQAVLAGYDVNVSFSENFYSLLGAICPASVYCPGHTTNATESRISSEREERVSEARSILRNNAHKLWGCCSTCSCEDTCKERQNCCPVMETAISDSDSEEPDQLVLQNCVYANLKYYYPSGLFATADKTGWSFFMVTNCFSANVSEETVTKCKRPDIYKPDETRPVYSAVSGRMYKNIFCALCNEDNEIMPWIPVIAFYGQFSLTESRKLFSSPDELYALAIRSHRHLDIFYKPPAYNGLNEEQFACVPSYRTDTAVEVCRKDEDFDNDQNDFFKRACNMQTIYYNIQNVWFKNAFCSLCYDYNIYGDRGSCGMSARDPTSFSFSAVLRYDQNELISTAEGNDDAKKTACKCTEYFDGKKKLCRQLMCPIGTIFVDCSCKEFLENMTRMAVKVYIEITPKIPGRRAQELFGGQSTSNIRNAFVAEITRVLKSRWGPLKSECALLFCEMYSSNKEFSKVHGVVLVNFKNNVDIRKNIQGVFNALFDGIWTNVLKVSVRISLGWNFDIKSDLSTIGIALSKLINDTSVTMVPLTPDCPVLKVALLNLAIAQTVTKLVYCKRVELQKDEIEHIQNDPAALSLSEMYLSYVFMKEDRSMCIDDFQNAFVSDASVALSCCEFDTVLSLVVIWNNLSIWL